MVKIVYTFDDRVNSKELFELLEEMQKSTTDKFPAASVFHCALRNPEKEELSLQNTIAVTARNSGRNNRLVGYLRLLTDHAYIYYILDVMVDPEYRKQGIGKQLLDLTVNDCKKDGFIKIFLTAIPGSESFYQQFGFKEGMSPVLTIRGEDYT